MTVAVTMIISMPSRDGLGLPLNGCAGRCRRRCSLWPPIRRPPSAQVGAEIAHAPSQALAQERPQGRSIFVTAQLYLDGKIDQWYSLQGRAGVAFILSVTDANEARAMLEALPLGQAHLMTFELTLLGPLNPLRQLLTVPGSP